MNPMAKWMITIGIVLIVAGLIWQAGGRFLNLGRLPGDIVVERENFKFYFPVVTCLVVSAVLSLIFYVARFFK